jgi:hypothetical protein
VIDFAPKVLPEAPRLCSVPGCPRPQYRDAQFCGPCEIRRLQRELAEAKRANADFVVEMVGKLKLENERDALKAVLREAVEVGRHYATCQTRRPSMVPAATNVVFVCNCWLSRARKLVES